MGCTSTICSDATRASIRPTGCALLLLMVLAAQTVHAQPLTALSASVRQGATLALDAEDSLVLMGNGEFLDAVDVSDPEQPVLLARFDLEEIAWDLTLEGTRAYVRTGNGVLIVDVSDPKAMVPRGLYPRWVTYIDVEGDFLYASDTDSLFVVDVSDPDSPTQVGALASSDLGELEAAYPLVFGAEHFGGSMRIIDVADPTQPVLRATVPGGSGFGWQLVTHSGDIVFAADIQTIHAYDVTDPDNPQPLGSVAVPYNLLLNVVALGVVDDQVFLRRLEEVYVFDAADPTAMDLLGWIPVPYGTESAYAEGRAYIGGIDLGLLILDTTDPGALTELGRLFSGGAFQDAAFDNGRLYLSGGLKYAMESISTYDLEDPVTPQLLARATVDHWDDLRIRDGIAYATYLIPGTWQYDVLAADISNPASPKVLSTAGVSQGYDFTGVEIGDSTLFLNSTFDGVYSIDIRDPSGIAFLDRIELGFPGGALAVENGLAFASIGRTNVIDVSRPDALRLLDVLDFEFYDMVFRFPYAYATVGNACIDVLDLSIPNSVELIHEVCPTEADFISRLVWFDEALYATGGATDQAALFRFRLDNTSMPTLEETIILRASPKALAASENRLVVPYERHGFDVFVPGVLTGVPPDVATEPLLEIAPNPLGDSAEIRFAVTAPGRIRVEIFDLLGRRVALLTDEQWAAGVHVLRWTPDPSMASGTYLVRLTAGDSSRTRSFARLR